MTHARRTLFLSGIALLMTVTAVPLAAAAPVVSGPFGASTSMASAQQQARVEAKPCAMNTGAPTGEGPSTMFFTDEQHISTFGGADFRLDRRCRVSTIEVKGSGGIDERSDLTAWIYGDAQRRPNEEALKCTTTVDGFAAGVDTTLEFPMGGCTLRPGRYWLVVQVAQGSGPQDPYMWGWALTEQRKGYKDTWMDLNGAYAFWCMEWESLDDCFDLHQDYIFTIKR